MVNIKQFESLPLNRKAFFVASFLEEGLMAIPPWRGKQKHEMEMMINGLGYTLR